jgi:hypothetical protein
MAATHKSRIQSMLNAFGRELTAGKGKEIAERFALPAFVVGDDMAMPITEKEQIAKFFGQGPEQYNKLGIVDTRPEIDQIEPLTEKLYSVDVRWPYIHADGHETAGEASRYLVQLDDDDVRIRAVTMRGVLEA